MWPRSIAVMLISMTTLTACRNKDGEVIDTSAITETGSPTIDADSDGYDADEDCDDANSVVNPGAEEICDGVDNNCDGTVDEDVTSTFYEDVDGDGFGDPGSTVEGCEVPDGYVATGTDCDDYSVESYPGAPEQCDGLDNNCNGEIDEDVRDDWYADADGDGFGDADSAFETCDPPPGYVTDDTDCDDTEASAFPGGEEVCDEVDNNCNGTVDENVTTTFYQDTDGDGFGVSDTTTNACDLPTGYAEIPGDCDDTDGAISPNATEICDSIDNNCDGVTDTDAIDQTTFYADNDTDGFGDADTTTTACDQPSGYLTDDADCDDSDSDINPDAAEVCDGEDNNCSGYTDDDDPDLTDGTTWYIDYDGDSYGSTSFTVTTCDAPTGYVDNADDCNDTTALASPDGSEVCDSLDNDCNGTVDDDASDALTWYEDADADGFGAAGTDTEECDQPSGHVDNDDDCDDTDSDINPDAEELWYDGIDSDCNGEEDPDPCDGLPEGTTVEYDDTCGYDFADPADWSVSVEWSSDDVGYSAGTSYVEVMMTPVVGQLTDDNGDGLVDEHDIPDIAYTTFAGSGYASAGYLRVLSGDGTAEHLSTATSSSVSIHASGGVAIGDIDDDGYPDILTTSTSGYLLAMESDGTAKWISDYPSYAGYCHPKIHDLDADGTPELILCDDVYDNTGAWQYSIGSIAYYSPAVADINNDGEMEIFTGDALFLADGTEDFSTGYSSSAVAVGNFDSDDAGELVIRDGTYVYLLDDDGALIWSASAQGYGYPCVGDLDGDGEMEIGVAGHSTFTALDTDGTTMWTTSVSDLSSGTMGCSVFDLNGDGAAEVIHADRYDLFIWDGTDGTELYNEPSAASGSLFEHPVVADVDGDGSAEIVFPSNNYSISGYDGVYILGEDNNEWASARGVWNQEDYSPAHANEDGSIPTDTTAPWLDDIGFRTQATPSGPANAAPDWSATIIGVCEDCDGASLEAYVVVDNVGSVYGPSGVTVSLYAVDGSDTTLLESQTLDGRVEAGERTAPLTFSLSHDDLGADGLLTIIDSDDAQHECDEDNNEDTWSATTCE